MKKLISFICILIFLVACDNLPSEVYKQATVTFTDGTTKVYKIRWCVDSDYGTCRLKTIEGERIYLSNVKEVSIKTIVNHKTQY